MSRFINFFDFLPIMQKIAVVASSTDPAGINIRNKVIELPGFETYKKGTIDNEPWYAGHNAPAEILNPTKYLLNSLYNSKNRKIFV